MTPLVPLQQAQAFVRAAGRLGWPAHLRTGADGRTWVETCRRLPGIGTVRLVSRGPVGAGPDWLCVQRGTLLLNADGPTPAMLRAAGYWPLATPATVALLTLGPEAEMRACLRGKWRNRLVRAEEAGIEITCSALPPDPAHWLLRHEARQARMRRYSGWPPALAAAFSAENPGGARLFTARRGGEVLAGLVLLCDAGTATWQIGATLPEGRRFGAMPLLLWHAMRRGAEAGCRHLDLGTVDTAGAPGLARFKLGTGARLHRLGGTWLRTPVLARLARRLPSFWAA